MNFFILEFESKEENEQYIICDDCANIHSDDFPRREFHWAEQFPLSAFFGVCFIFVLLRASAGRAIIKQTFLNLVSR